ncbi:MAG: cobalt-precorrin-5B (C(1))-methyltransferase CbiD [Lachnospiraceae bacterium]|nr:cobalt-precorrin-5B (C(1))-methyltransferase CbiD [Lachnospiraceae bacterium]
MKNGLEECFVIKNNQKLRYGYTTGSCAAAAAQAAVRMLFSGKTVDAVRLKTPKGMELFLEPLYVKRESGAVTCAIRKDAGDDPDVTDGMLVCVRVRTCGRDYCAEQMRRYGQEAETEDSGLPGSLFLTDTDEALQADPAETVQGDAAGFMQAGEGIDRPASEHMEQAAPRIAKCRPAAVCILGGEGIGTVTLPGLEQPVGAPAINRVPRGMIRAEVRKVCREYGYTEGIEVTVSAPEGRVLAEKTFNPKLGIRGGISILGTSGIVEPMSEQALVSAIEAEMRQKSVSQRYLLVTPGNYGTEYLAGHFPFDSDEALKCGNYVGQTIDMAVNLEFSGILFVAHIGKFVKVAGGIMNTHSREADARMEILAACALQTGIDADPVRQILDAATTDEGLRIIDETGIRQQTLDILMRKIDDSLNRRAQYRMKIGAVVFSNRYGELGRTESVPGLLDALCKQRS